MFVVGGGLEDVDMFFTIDEILGRAGLKDMTEGVLSVFVAVVLCDVGWLVRDLHLFVEIHRIHKYILHSSFHNIYYS